MIGFENVAYIRHKNMATAWIYMDVLLKNERIFLWFLPWSKYAPDDGHKNWYIIDNCINPYLFLSSRLWSIYNYI